MVCIKKQERIKDGVDSIVCGIKDGVDSIVCGKFERWC